MFNIFRRKAREEKASQAVSGGRWLRILESFTGAWQRNIEVDSATVLAYHAVFSCISLISADIAKMPLLLKKKLSTGIWADHDDTKISPLLKKPNSFQTRMQFFESWMNSKLSDGNTYVLKIRDTSGLVKQWRVLDPNKVTPYITDDGEIFYQVRPDNIHGIETQVMVPAREIIHDRFNCFFHPLCGLSPIYACGLTAMQGDAILTNSANHFKNGGKPGGVITVPGSVDEDKAREIKAAWDEGYSGANAGKTGLLADGAGFMTIAMTAVDAQMVEQLNLTAKIICSTFHVPLYKVDTATTPSYNNIEALDQGYYSQCLQTHIEAIELLLDEALELDAQTGVEFDLDVLIRMDTEGRYKAYGEGIGAGFLTPNQARRKENMPPVDGGDTPYMQQQNYSLAALAKRDAQANPFGSSPEMDSDPEIPPEDDKTSKALPEHQRSMAVSMLRGYLPMNERDMSLLQVVGEAVKEQFIAMQIKYDAALAEKSERILQLEQCLAEQALQIKDVQRSMPGETAIVQAVLAKIDVPSAPELQDVARMVTDAVATIQPPAPPELPDIGAMVKAAVAQQVADIDVPQPEPLPDLANMIADAVAALPKPEFPALPDIGTMVKAAVVAEVSGLEVPQPEPLPDIEQMVRDAVAALPPAKDGVPGNDGKDALQIEILPYIDAEKSYPRGTYAIHQGGTWRSFQKTTGMNGWECLVDGISSIDISQSHEREFTVSAQLASGAVTEKTFSIPVMIYRDIFKEGEKYYPGDSVTWGGSVWYCCEETTYKPGEPGVKGWKLAVKRGRDARSKA